MDSDLKSLYCHYVDIVRNKIQAQYVREDTQRLDALVILRNDVLTLQALVDELENSEPFTSLVRKTVASFPENSHFGRTSAAQAVGHFFRRSRCYIDVFKNQVIDPESLFHTYEHACQRQERQVTYLVPLQGVEFAESRMDFGKFVIQSFSHRQLNELVSNDVNLYFYHDAIVDTRCLRCPFICCETTEDLIYMHKFEENFYKYLFSPIAAPYTHFPKIVEDMMVILFLYDWSMGDSQFLKDMTPTDPDETSGDSTTRWLRELQIS